MRLRGHRSLKKIPNEKKMWKAIESMGANKGQTKVNDWLAG